MFTGHDVVWIDQRGVGRSDGVTDCPDLAKYPVEIQTGNLGKPAVDAFQACFKLAENNAVPFASIFDHGVVAADYSVVRRALGIASWSLYAGSAGADIAVHLVNLEPQTIKAIVTRSPTAVGAGLSPNNLADAFARYAADCAAAPKCAANGDLRAVVAAIYEREKTPIVTKTIEKGTGIAAVLDHQNLFGGIESAMGNVALSPGLPGLLKGIVDGSTDEAVAGAFASYPYDTFAWGFPGNCGDDDYVAPGLVHTESDHAGIFATYSSADVCSQYGPIPKRTVPPKVTSDIPVLAVIPSYDARSSDTTAAAVFAGFSTTTIVDVPRIVDPLTQLTDCFYATANTFLADPAGKLDTSCLTSPAVSTLS